MVSVSLREIPSNTLERNAFAGFVLHSSQPDDGRHRPGDTWIIEPIRDYYADDPGAWRSGNTRHQPDQRTGRHRRGEAPDPLPARRPSPRPAGPDGLPEQVTASLREHAWSEFLRLSQIFYDAHLAPAEPRLRARIARWLRSAVRSVFRSAPEVV